MKIMINIETNGTDRNNMEVLEVAALPVYMDPFTGYYAFSGINPFSCLIHSRSEPKSDLAKRTQVGLYKLCNELPAEQDKAHCREKFLGWLNLIGRDRWSRNMVGKNVVTFDLDILDQVGILLKDEYHYRVHEQTGGIFLLEGAMKLGRDEVCQAALAVTPTPIPKEIKELGSHRALYDCYEQVALENGMIRLIRLMADDRQDRPSDLDFLNKGPWKGYNPSHNAPYWKPSSNGCFLVGFISFWLGFAVAFALNTSFERLF